MAQTQTLLEFDRLASLYNEGQYEAAVMALLRELFPEQRYRPAVIRNPGLVGGRFTAKLNQAENIDTMIQMGRRGGGTYGPDQMLLGLHELGHYRDLVRTGDRYQAPVTTFLNWSNRPAVGKETRAELFAIRMLRELGLEKPSEGAVQAMRGVALENPQYRDFPALWERAGYAERPGPWLHKAKTPKRGKGAAAQMLLQELLG